MALNHTTLHTVVGKYIKSVDSNDALISTIETLKGEIGTVLENASLTRLYDTVPSTFEGFKNDVSQWIAGIIGQAALVITDRDFVVEELPIINSSLNSVLVGLIADMTTQSVSVLESAVTIGTITDNVTAATTGDLLVDATLDGVSPPIANAPATVEYLGVTSEMSYDSDTIYCECTSDSSDGGESWQLYSKANFTAPYQSQEETAGLGPVIRTANAAAGSLGVLNSDFETFSTTDEPDGWTTTGTVTTDYGEENVASLVFRGTSSLQINTSGTSLKQKLSGVVPKKMYLFCLQAARLSTYTGTLDVVLEVENSDGSTVYKTSTTEIAVPAGASDQFIPVKLYWWVDDSVDLNDIYINITVNNFATSPTAVYLDEVLVTAPTYYNGVNFAMLRGTTPFVLGDRFQLAITNDNAGVIQRFFRRAFKVQLVTAGSPTIADSLAT